MPFTMYVMADSDLGIRIKRARERKRLSQQALADAIGAAVRSVGRWERGEAVPRAALALLEDALTPYFRADPDQPEMYTDPDEAALWALTTYSEDERRAFIEALRAQRRARAG